MPGPPPAVGTATFSSEVTPAALTLTRGGSPLRNWIICMYWPPAASNTGPMASPPLMLNLTSPTLPGPRGSPGRTNGVTETSTRSKPSGTGSPQVPHTGQSGGSGRGNGHLMSTTYSTYFHHGKWQRRHGGHGELQVWGAVQPPLPQGPVGSRNETPLCDPERATVPRTCGEAFTGRPLMASSHGSALAVLCECRIVSTNSPGWGLLTDTDLPLIVVLPLGRPVIGNESCCAGGGWGAAGTQLVPLVSRQKVTLLGSPGSTADPLPSLPKSTVTIVDGGLFGSPTRIDGTSHRILAVSLFVKVTVRWARVPVWAAAVRA